MTIDYNNEYNWPLWMRGKRYWNLRYQQINSKGAQGLADALRVNSTLEELDLSHNEIDFIGAEALAESLKQNSTLKVLNLGSNHIDSTGAQELAESLKHNTTLQKLNLFNNQIDSKGAQAMAESLKHNSTLLELKLNGNNEDFGPMNFVKRTPPIVLQPEAEHVSLPSSPARSDHAESEDGKLYQGFVDFSSLQLRQPAVGTGGFGKVYIADVENYPSPVAVKILCFDNDEEVSQLQKEFSKLFSLRHRNLVRVIGCFNDAREMKAGYTMEYMNKGSLRDLLSKNGALPVKEALQYCCEVAQGLQYLHSQQIIHNNLKPENILLHCKSDEHLQPNGKTNHISNSSMQVKLCDLEASTALNTISHSFSHGLMTFAYCSPERLCGKLYSFPSDIYSFGLLMNELLTGEKPFRDMEDYALPIRVLMDGVRPALPENIPNGVRELIESCWHADTTKRPLIVEVLAKLKILLKRQ